MDEKKFATFKEAVITVVHPDSGKLVALIYEDPMTKQSVFYQCNEMKGEDIAPLISKTLAPLNGRSFVAA